MVAHLFGKRGPWFRGMMRDDLREVLAIEAEAFAVPWSEQDLVDELEDPDCVVLVVESDTGILGYLIFDVDGEWIRIHSCAVKAEFRRQGIGRGMLHRLIATAAAGRQTGVVVKVAEGNLQAQLYFRSSGFRAIRTLRRHLVDGQDVYVMEYLMPGMEGRKRSPPRASDELVPLWDAKHA